MYCVIQQIKYKSKEEFKNKKRLETELNKSNRFRGCAKELKVTTFTHGVVGDTKTKYTYKNSEERFERNNLDAYKISIHHSYREGGKVKKKQWAIGTIGYYDVIEYGTYDFIDTYFEKVLDEMNEAGFEVTYDELESMVYEKFQPILDAIDNEWVQTEEYKVKQYQQEVLNTYRKKCAEFKNTYGIDEYAYVYDIFGNLMNEELLNKIKEDKKRSDEYQKQSERAHWDRINEEWKRTHNSDGSRKGSIGGSYCNEDEKKMLHEIYRMASKKFHPDACGDDGTKMKFLTKLKEQWGL